MIKSKKVCTVLLLIVSLVLFGTAYAGTYTVQASATFDAVYVSCSSTMSTTFYARTKADCSSIKVTSVILQKKSGTSWVNDKTLTAPSKTVTNDYLYSTISDYSDNVGTGTYRIKAVFNADGVTTTAYSNERTFN